MENASFMKKMLMMVAIAMMTTVVLTSCEKDDDSDDWEPSLPSQRTVMRTIWLLRRVMISARWRRAWLKFLPIVR